MCTSKFERDPEGPAQILFISTDFMAITKHIGENPKTIHDTLCMRNV